MSVNKCFPLPETMISFVLSYLGFFIEKRILETFCKTLEKTRLESLRNPQQQVQIIHRSEHFLVANKDFDVRMNSSDPMENESSLHGILARQFPNLVNSKYEFGFSVPHRLDYATSGIIVIPLTKAATSAAHKEFQKRRVQKLYLAILYGHVIPVASEINYAIGDDSRAESNNIKMCTSRQSYCKNPRDAQTRLLLLSRGYFNEYKASKVLLKLITGRRHQLRVHCHEIKHRIIGDFTYSDRADGDKYRMFLHAIRLFMKTPMETLDIKTEDPFETNLEDRNSYRVTEEVWNIQQAIENYDFCFEQSLTLKLSEKVSHPHDYEES